MYSVNIYISGVILKCYIIQITLTPRTLPRTSPRPDEFLEFCNQVMFLAAFICTDVWFQTYVFVANVKC